MKELKLQKLLGVIALAFRYLKNIIFFGNNTKYLVGNKLWRKTDCVEDGGCDCKKENISWTDKIKIIMGEIREFMWAMLTGDTSTNLVDKKFQILLEDSEFSNELYTKVHDNKVEFEIEKDGKKHKYRKIKI